MTSSPSTSLLRPHDSGGWWLVGAEVAALALVACLVGRTFAFADAVAIVLAFVVAYLVPRFVLSTSSVASRGANWWLLLIAFALGCYTVLSIKAITIDCSLPLEAPNLLSDDSQYYKWALAHYDGRCEVPKISFKGLPLLMLGLWKVLGVSIVWPLALNFMFTLLTIVYCGKTASRLLAQRFSTLSPQAIALVAMLLISLMGFFLSQNVRVQKEAACALGMALAGYAIVGLTETADKKRIRQDVTLFTLGCLLLALVRTNFGYFAILGPAMMLLDKRCSPSRRRAVIMAAVAAAITVVFSVLFSYTFGQQYRTVDGGDAMARAFKIGFVQQPYASLVGDYYHYPEWRRLLLLPITAGVQYIIPFPWIYETTNSDIFNILPRVRLMWYFVGGVCIFYYLFIFIVHNKERHLGMWAWWPLACFFIIAFITGGTVSRYILPLQPLFVVVAMYVLCCVKTGHYHRSFTMWMIVYTFIMIALLLVCHQVQISYLDNLSEYYRQRALMRGH